MNFSTAAKVLGTIRMGDNAEANRSANRAKVLRAANNFPLLDPEEAKKAGLKINTNWGEMMVLLAHARRQYLNAFWSNRFFFNVKIPQAPKDRQSEWEAFITDSINEPMRDSLKYFELHRSRWASTVMHGIGPMIWYRKDRWCPDYVAVADMRIPTDTTLDMDNLAYFAVLKRYTPGELLNQAFNGKKKNGWNKQQIETILKAYRETNNEDPANAYDWDTNFERTVELMKQDGAYWTSDAAPSIPLWHFYFEDNTDEANPGWFMRIVPKDGSVKGVDEKEKFLWESNTPIAPSLSQLAHWQFGDLNGDSPFKYNSVRSLGFSLLEPCFYTNLTRCRMLQHVHDNFNIWLKSNDPVDRARAAVQMFGNFGMVQPGIEVVPQNQRHQVQAELVETTMAQLKQLQQEASASYTQSTDTGTKKEQTAFETRVKMEQVNAMMSGLLLQAFVYEAKADKEIARRFCISNSMDPEVQEFQKKCDDFGIPKAWLDISKWKIEPVTPLGMGNPTVASASAQQLLQMRPMYDPSAQQEILHEATLQVTQDPRKAARWVPLGKKPVLSDAKMYIQSIFAALMDGVVLEVPEALPPTEQLDKLLQLLAEKVQIISQRNNMATQDEAAGFNAAGNYAQQLLQRIAQDPADNQVAKQLSDKMGQIGNIIKGLVQRGQEAMKKQQQQNGNGIGMEELANARATIAKAGIDAKVKQSKMVLQAQKFKADEQRKNAGFIMDQHRKNVSVASDITRDHAKTHSEINQSKMKAFDE